MQLVGRFLISCLPLHTKRPKQVTRTTTNHHNKSIDRGSTPESADRAAALDTLLPLPHDDPGRSLQLLPWTRSLACRVRLNIQTSHPERSHCKVESRTEALRPIGI